MDLEIRNRSRGRHSLDDVMRLLWVRYGRDFYQGDAIGVDEDALPALIREATGVDPAAFIERHVHGYDDVPLDTLLGSQGIDMRWEPANPRPTLDVRLRASDQGLAVATVYAGGAAHRGGLSAGDVLVAVDGLRINGDRKRTRLNPG